MRSNRLAVRLQVTQVWAGAGFHGDAPSSPTLGQAEVLALLLRLEAVVIAAAAAVPEASALVALGVEEPHHGVAPAAALALVLVQEAVVCRGQHSAQRRARVGAGVCGWFLPLDLKRAPLGFSNTFGSADRKDNRKQEVDPPLMRPLPL